MPDDHLAWSVIDVMDRLGLSQLTEEYLHLAGGRPGFHPVMMAKQMGLVKLGHEARRW